MRAQHCGFCTCFYALGAIAGYCSYSNAFCYVAAVIFPGGLLLGWFTGVTGG